MALDYGSVKDMYDTLYDAGVTTKTLPEWSQDMNELTNTQLYNAGLHDNWIKRTSHGIDKILESTGLPGYGEQLGRSVGGLVGAPEAGAEVGHGLPRSVLNFAPLLIPGGGVPAVAAKLGLTGALTAGETYEKTDSPLASLISGGVATALPGVAGKASDVVGSLLSKSIGVPSIAGPVADLEGNVLKNITQYFPETFAQKAIPKVGGELAGQAAAAGVMGAAQPLQQLAEGETPTSPFTTENALNLTLGQLPFAALHIGGKALGLHGEAPEPMKADDLQKIIDMSAARIKLKTAADDLANKTEIEKGSDGVADETQQPEVSYETKRQTRLLLQSVRGEQIALKDDPNLTDEQKVERMNDLLNQDFDLQKKNTAEDTSTILGNGINEDTTRQEIVGKQLAENRSGTWRAVQVLDDPTNPPDLVGRVIGYSTKSEPSPQHFGLSTLNTSPINPVGKFSLPDPQWWSHNKTVDEWNQRYVKKQGEIVSPWDQPPELPTQERELTDEQVSMHLNELKNIYDAADAADSPGDLQSAVVHLNGVEAENNLPTTNDATISRSANQLINAGFNPDDAVKATVKARTRRVARELTAGATATKAQVTRLLKAGFDQETIDKMDGEQRADALGAIKSLRETERGAPKPTKEEAATVSAQFEAGKGTNPGFSVITADKLSHSHEEDTTENQPLKDLVTDAAVAAAKSPEATAAFQGWEGHEDTTIGKDFTDFLDLVQNYTSLKNVDPDEAAKTLNDRFGTTTWDAQEVKDFINRPHVQEWSKGLDAELVRMQTGNGSPFTYYHGTQLPVEKFVAGHPVYLTSDIEAARSYARNSERASEGARVPPREGQPTVLNVKTDFQNVAKVDDVENVIKELGVKDSVDDVLFGTSIDSGKVFDELSNRGYDAVDYHDQNAETGDVIPAVLSLKPEDLQVADQTKIAAPGTVGRADAPEWVPDEQRDIDKIQQMGIAQGGKGMLQFLQNSGNPLFTALAKDLSKFGDSLSRIRGSVRDIESGALTRRLPGDQFEISLSPAVLREPDFEQNYTVAHELIHGLTMAELGRPTNSAIYDGMNDLREKVIAKLPKDMKAAYNNAIENGWYDKYMSATRPEDGSVESLMPKGTSEQRATLYALLNTDEFVAQGLSENSFRQFLKGIKSDGGGWYHRFTNYVKTLLGIGENISNTAFEEFLSKTDQLLTRGNYVSSFKNFSDRYFENLGHADQYVRSNTQRAMALMLGAESTDSPMVTLSMLRAGVGAVRSPEWATSYRDAIRMFNEKGDDAAVTHSVLDETGHQSNLNGLNDMTDSLMLGETSHDALELLPEAAARYIFETAKDAQNILGVIRAATLEHNKGIVNIADPGFIRNIAKQTLKGVDAVVGQSRLHDMQIRDMQGLLGMTPDNYLQDMIRGALEKGDTKSPEWATDETKRSWGQAIQRFIEPIGQLARRVGPEASEAFARGWQLNANMRKMMSESVKAFGMDLSTMTLTKETVKNMQRALVEPRITDAVNKWIYENQLAGKRTGETRVIEADDPRIVNVIGNLSKADRDVVEDIVNKHQISMQHMQEQVLEKGLQIASTNGAVIAQRLNGGKLKDNVALSEQLLKAFTADRSDPNMSAIADQQIAQVQAKMDPDSFLALARFTKSAADSWQAQREWFKTNPAWSTAQRYGKLLVEYKKNGKTFTAGVDTKQEAEQITGGRPFKLTKNSQYDEDRPPILGPDSVGIVNRLRELEGTQLDILRSSGAFSPDQIAQIQQYSPSEQFATEETYRGGVPGLTPPTRGLTKGASELPWLRNHFSWVSKTANYWSRQLLRAQARAHLLDPEIAQNEQLRRDLQTHYDNILQPDSQVGRLAQRAAMTWFMGFNPASAMINATQPFLTHVAELTSMSGKPLDSYRRVLSAIKDVFANKLGKDQWSDEGVGNMIHEAYQSGELDLSKYDDQAEAQESIHTNYKRLLSGNRTQTTGQRLSTLAGSYSTWGLAMFRTVEEMNNMAALIASYKYYRESEPNLSQDQLVAKAFEFNHAVNYGGGRAARPIGVFSGRGAFPRTAAMLATSMQSYNLGTTFQLVRYIKSGLFRPEGATPHEVWSARKAAVQMLATQFAAAGVLGLPFVSGMLSVLNSAFPNLEVNRHLREWMQDITGGDEQNGHVLNDIAMTGAPSMLGWDLQSRLSMGNTVPGVSEINGFQPENLLGAPFNLVSNFVKGGVQLASGNIPQAVDAFAPSAYKKLEQLLRSNGQVLDYRNRPIFTPTIGETVGIGLGFQPKRLSDYNAASRMAKQSDDNIKRREGDFHQQMAGEVLKGNFGTVRQALQQRSREDKTYDPREAVRSIAGAAEELTFPRDLRREGTVGGSDVRDKLLATFNLPPVGQPSEVDRLNFRQNVQQRLGLVGSSPTDLSTATVIDQLRQQNPASSRAELRQQATLLLHGRRLQTYPLQQE
jgi:hypothetical protein